MDRRPEEVKRSGPGTSSSSAGSLIHCSLFGLRGRCYVLACRFLCLCRASCAYGSEICHNDRLSEQAISLLHAGNQATLQYQQTVTYFKPLWKQLRHRAVHPEMVAGLHMIIQDIHNRNYLHAYSLYMSLAIGAHLAASFAAATFSPHCPCLLQPVSSESVSPEVCSVVREVMRGERTAMLISGH